MNNIETWGYENNPILKEVQEFLKDKMSILFAFEETLMVPSFSELVPTAGALFDMSNEDKFIDIVFNEEFWNSLNALEKNFVFSHEVFHIMFDHRRRGNAYTKSIGVDPNSQSVAAKLNIAMDICINEILFTQYFQYNVMEDFPVLGPMVCTIKTVFKEKADSVLPRQNFQYYYEKIEELLGSSADEMSGGVDIAIDFGDLSEEEAKAIEAVINGFMEDSSDMEKGEKPGGKVYGLGGNKSSGEIKDVPTSGSLNDCLKDVMGKSKKSMYSTVKTNWYATNRRTVTLSKAEFTVPTYTYTKPDYIPRILVYADVSGSVAYVSNKFFSLIKKIDEKKYEVDTYAWASYVSSQKVNLASKAYHGCGGGTNIKGVLDHFSKLKEQYDAVIVLTDGEYSNVKSINDEKYSNWNFFYTTKYKNAPAKAKEFFLTDW